MIPGYVSHPTEVFYPTFGESKQKEEIKDEDVTTEDLKIVIASFPENQRRNIHYVKPATLRYNKELDFDGIIACSPHFVGIFRRDPKTKKPSKSVVFHVFQIESMIVRSPTKLLLFSRLEELMQTNPVVNCRIINATALKFSQILRRNYMLSACVFKPKELCDFKSKNMREFPHFVYDLSVTQQFQFLYSAFAARMRMRYIQDVTEIYHDKIKYEDGIFNFSLFPEMTQQEMDPVIRAMCFFPYVHGVICHNSRMSWIASMTAHLFKRSRNLRFVHYENCGISTGVDEIGERILNNPKIPISYYNFSRNPIGDGLQNLFQALKIVTQQVFYINIGCCGARNLEALFQALKDNENLWNLKYLFFNGNDTKGVDSRIFCEYLENLNEKGIHTIKSLGIGGCDSCVAAILRTLSNNPQPIQLLTFEGTRMQRESAGALIEYIQKSTCLEILDLSYTAMRPNDMANIILELSKIEKIKNISIRLNGNDLTGVNLMTIAKGFLYSDLSVWTSVSLADNRMNTNDLDFLISFLWRMPNLRELDLSRNFSEGMECLEEIFTKISIGYLPNLKVIKIAGAGHGVGRSMYTFLDNCTLYKDLTIFDVSNNNIGDAGLEKMEAVLRENKNIHTLYMDGNNCSTIESYEKILNYVYSNETITYCTFPIYDIGRFVMGSQDKPEARRRCKDMYNNFFRELNIHRKHAGMPIMLPFEAVPELGELTEEIRGHMHEILQDVNTKVHNGVCKDMGLTLPYLPEGIDIEEGGKVKEVDIGDMVKYRSEYMKLRIHEKRDRELMGGEEESSSSSSDEEHNSSSSSDEEHNSSSSSDEEHNSSSSDEEHNSSSSSDEEHNSSSSSSDEEHNSSSSSSSDEEHNSSSSSSDEEHNSSSSSSDEEHNSSSSSDEEQNNGSSSSDEE